VTGRNELVANQEVIKCLIEQISCQVHIGSPTAILKKLSIIIAYPSNCKRQLETYQRMGYASRLPAVQAVIGPLHNFEVGY